MCIILHKYHLVFVSVQSPTSMKVTHRQLTKGREMSFADCFIMEYRLARRSMMNKDFYEGVRAGMMIIVNAMSGNVLLIMNFRHEYRHIIC